MKSKFRTKWSEEDENILLENVKKHANNLQAAFKITSVLVKRSPGACEQHWYLVLRKKKQSVCFATIGYKTKNVNTKIVTKHTSNNTQKTSANWWRKFCDLLNLS